MYFAGYKLHVRGALPERNDMLWDILYDFHVMERSQTRNNMFEARCATKVHCDNVLHKKLHVEGTVQGKDDVLTAYDKNVSNVARRNDKLRDVFFRGDGILWMFSQPGDSMVTTHYGRNSMLQVSYRREMIYWGCIVSCCGCSVDKKRRVQDMLQYEGVC